VTVIGAAQSAAANQPAASPTSGRGKGRGNGNGNGGNGDG
jgi:hypothetical protein